MHKTPSVKGRSPSRAAAEAGGPKEDDKQVKVMLAGWREHVALPEWGIESIVAKLDSGACISAIHVAHLEHLPGERAQFDVIVKMNGRDGQEHLRSVHVNAPIVRVANIRPSHGKVQERIVVSTLMRLGLVERRIELSLVCRKRMRWRMLLGRSALKGDFLIDPSRTMLLDRST